MPGANLEIFKNEFLVKGDDKPNIKFEKFTLDENSEKISKEDNNDYVGVVTYKVPGVPAGTVFVEKTDDIQFKKDDEGKVHGGLCRKIFGTQPAEITNAGGCVNGFAVRNGKLELNSSTCNKKGSYNDGKREINEIAKDEISKTIFK